MRKALLLLMMALVVTAGTAPAADAVQKPAKKTARKTVKKAKAIVYADYSKPESSGNTWGDEAKGCGAAFEKKGGRAVVTVKACAEGWGSGLTLWSSVDPFDAEGTTKIVVKMKATKGLRMVFSQDEKGCGPREATSFVGSNGADGERWDAVEVLGTGKVKEYTFKLADLKAAAGYGNQNGNKVLDLKGLGGCQFYFPVQGAGTMEVSSIKFQ